MRRNYGAALLIGGALLGLAVFGGVWAGRQRAFAVVPGKLELVAKLTGPGSINQTDVRSRVLGTDLGIIWESKPGEVLIAFGDTFGHGWSGSGGGPGSAEWRSNILARSTDRDLADGLLFDLMEAPAGFARELLASQKRDHAEITVIPTAGVTVGGRSYLHYMSVNHWGKPGEWFTNYSGLAYSDDDGATWTKDPAARWPNDAAWQSKFQMVGFAREGGFVYLLGTPNGRFGNASLARVPEAELLRKEAYRYWDGSSWLADEAAAVAVVPGPIGELSVHYSPELRRWLLVYLDAAKIELVLRDAPALTGPWSAPRVLATNADYPQLYGGYIHPWSTGTDLYLTVSQWGPYNVFLMHTRLARAAQ